VTTFAISRLAPIIITAVVAAANIAVKPTTLYQAAIPLNVSAVSSANVLRLNVFLKNSGIIIFMKKYTQISVYYCLGSGGSPSPKRYPYMPINSVNSMTNFLGMPGPCWTWYVTK
jgi:hypothetical protein